MAVNVNAYNWKIDALKSTVHLYTRGHISKVPRKILGKLLILGATDTQVATSSRGYSATVEHCTNRHINFVQRSNRKLCSSSSSNSSSKIRSFPKIFLGSFENAVPVFLCKRADIYIFMTAICTIACLAEHLRERLR